MTFLQSIEISPLLTYLNTRFGTNLQTDYYRQIELWRAWWQGFVKSFHSFHESDGEHLLERHLFSMRMAKKICEDWASILLNEKTEIAVADSASSLFLQGKKQTTGILGQNDFWEHGNELIERAFFSGTGAFVLHLTGAQANPDGLLYPTDSASITLDYLDALSIFPLSVKQGKITEAVFASIHHTRGVQEIYLEEHLFQQGEYVIVNELFHQHDGALEPVPLPPGVIPVFHTGSPVPWFSIVKPNIANPFPQNNGLGLSIFANALDELQNVDLAFNNFVRDFKLGGKKVFYNKSMLHRTPDGQLITPDDVAQQLFLQVDADGELDTDLKTLVQEYNPSLRVAENTQGIQAALDYLSFKCGLGTRFYAFDGGTIQTATQYMGERQDLIQNANKQYIGIERALESLLRSILFMGKTLLKQPVDPETDISIKFEDSYIIDKEQERERDRQDVRDGLMQKWEYRVKWYGETKAQAKLNLDTGSSGVPPAENSTAAKSNQDVSPRQPASKPSGRAQPGFRPSGVPPAGSPTAAQNKGNNQPQH